MASSDSDNDNNDGFVFGHQPLAWILIPLFVILVLGLTATIIQVRRRRRRRGNLWPGNDPRAPASSGRGRLGGNRMTNRRAPWAGTRSQEGLNELGQAPPPYDGKKETQDPLELRDLEAGSSPPEYPAEPPPAVVSDGRRN